MYEVYWYDNIKNVSQHMKFGSLKEAYEFLRKIKKVYKKNFYFCLCFQV